MPPKGGVRPLRTQPPDRMAFQFYTDAAGKHRWRLKDSNGLTVADSGQGYEDERDAKNGANVFTRLGPNADEHETDGPGGSSPNPGWEYFPGSNGDWYWHFEAANGRVTADGAEGYDSKANVKRAIANVKALLRTLQSGNQGGGYGKPKPDGPGGGGRFA